MQNLLLAAGLICAVGAIVGGGVSLAGGKLPVIGSVPRQAMLFVLGAFLLFWAWKTPGDPDPSAITGANSATINQPPPAANTTYQTNAAETGVDTAALVQELADNEKTITDLQQAIDALTANSNSLEVAINLSNADDSAPHGAAHYHEGGAGLGGGAPGIGAKAGAGGGAPNVAAAQALNDDARLKAEKLAQIQKLKLRNETLRGQIAKAHAAG